MPKSRQKFTWNIKECHQGGKLSSVVSHELKTTVIDEKKTTRGRNIEGRGRPLSANKRKDRWGDHIKNPRRDERRI